MRYKRPDLILNSGVRFMSSFKKTGLAVLAILAAVLGCQLASAENNGKQELLAQAMQNSRTGIEAGGVDSLLASEQLANEALRLGVSANDIDAYVASNASPRKLASFRMSH